MRLVLVILLTAFVLLPVAEPTSAQGTTWASLGPAGDRGLGDPILHVAPTWPADRTLLALYQGWLARSSDDGATWARLPARFAQLRALWPAPGVDRTGIAFAFDEGSDSRGMPVLLRSVDGGSSWSPVVETRRDDWGTGRAAMTFSPSFETDGIAFFLVSGALYRTDDAGERWTEVSVAGAAQSSEDGVAREGQLVQSVHLSPEFGRDRTVYLAVGSAPYSSFPATNDRRYEAEGLPPPLPHNHATSLGVAVSRDGGVSWEYASAGLEIGGAPHRYVRQLAVSPTFASDHTLFAWAWGPAEVVRVETEQRLSFANALFRSQDAGSSWQVAWDRPTVVTDILGASVEPALSPAFSHDAAAVLAVTHPTRLRETSKLPDARKPDLYERCEIFRTSDGGTSWERVMASERRPNYQPCRDLLSVPTVGGWHLLVRNASGMSMLLSRDGGTTWSVVTPPRDRGPFNGPRMIASDGRLIATGGGRFWVHESGEVPRPEPGQPACAIDFDPRYEPVVERSISKQEYGCALEAPRAVRVYERSLRSVGGLRADDDPSSWLLVRGLRGGDGRFGGWERRSSATDPWPGPADREHDGTVQRVWGGLLMELIGQHGERSLVGLREPTPREPRTAYWYATGDLGSGQ